MRICSIPNCGEKILAKELCSKHYQEVRVFGEIRERTGRHKNEIIVDGNICRMKLYNNKNIEIAETIFDLKYKEEVEKYKWHLSNGYAEHKWYEKDNRYSIGLHQVIIELSGQEVPSGYEIDHKDTHPLNNLEINLRICTPSENSKNCKIKSNNTSGYRGVFFYKKVKKWGAKITINNKHIFLGQFIDKDDAARAYNAAALKYFGEFAQLNIIK